MSLVYAPIPTPIPTPPPRPSSPAPPPVVVNTVSQRLDLEKYIPYFMLFLAVLAVVLLYEVRSALVELRMALRSRAYASASL